ncbi:ubiquinone biosynthesis O-methyltransferase [Xylona heveae TC161]|uniref:Ubiquinone biosynthesis O-methyltransferase, mitochondrial n=1 Tax=Xylona heveae (strain CBS 132557 / TC161) TaxID=1328760 RepID=A0A165IHT3_XYLHT|nr:ubiquinone biosynthesis O-methyltransferase [Xylona heveae TC161]KZF24919.1 ubiquinone biosynthesis O-methyltransferase [Xylona heveae TC161]
MSSRKVPCLLRGGRKWCNGPSGARRSFALSSRKTSSARILNPDNSFATKSLGNSKFYTTTNPRSHSFSAPPNGAESNYTTVDPREVAHFNALASTWWDPHGPSRLLHLMNPLRHDFIKSCLDSAPLPFTYPETPASASASVAGPTASSAASSATSEPSSAGSEPTSASNSSARKLKYLDIGCGGGIFTESAARLSSTLSATGVDPTPSVLAVAQQHLSQDPVLQRSGKLKYLNTSIEQLPVPKTDDERVDILTLFEVIEHIEHPAPFLEKCMPFVKPGGWIIMSTIARTWTSWFTTKFVAEDLIGIVPRGTHEWERYINEPELRGWFAKQPGWGNIQNQGVVYVPGIGWKEVQGSEQWGNYFFGVRKDD